jgi:8-oxo-dGTP diphosphatase
MAQGDRPAGEGPQATTNWPRCGASAAIFRGEEVLLIERGKGALKGLWSLPGGHIEPGETARAAAVREVREETGVEAELAGLVDIHEVILHAPGGILRAHYLIAVFCGRWRGGEPVAGSDAAAARFLPAGEIEVPGRLPLTDGAAALIHRARARLQSGGI